MNTSDQILFADEAPAAERVQPARPAEPWKILIVDDEPDIHAVTRAVMPGFSFEGRPAQFLSAYSAADARAQLAANPDIALILLDVVMETDDAGLDLVRHIRQELKNEAVRIILRTGQPGQAPERDVIINYDINDYKAKTELSAQKLYTTTVAALRSYQHIRALERSRQGLELIIDAAGTLPGRRSTAQFAEGVVLQLQSLIQGAKGALLCSVATLRDEPVISVLAGGGLYGHAVGTALPDLVPPEVAAALASAAKQKQSLFQDEYCVIYAQARETIANLVFISGHQPLSALDRSLLELFCSRVAVSFDNASLVERLLDANARFELAADGTHVGIFDWDPATNDVFASQRLRDILPLTDPIALPPNWDALIDADSRSAYRATWASLLDGTAERISLELRTTNPVDGLGAWISLSAAARRGTKGKPELIAGAVSDISERKSAEQRLRDMAQTDPLTGLMNRPAFIAALDAAITRQRITGSQFGGIMIDLDRFKTVNDALGHDAGDAFLTEIAGRLQSVTRRRGDRQPDRIARLAGDEFAVLIEDVTSPDAVKRKADLLRAEINRPVSLRGQTIFPDCSIGLVTATDGYERGEDVLTDAGAAMARGKRHGGGIVTEFRPILRPKLAGRLSLEADLRQALEARALHLVYQPIVALPGRAAVGYEALMRWTDPARGPIPPVEFIPLAEETGLIVPMGAWALEEAAKMIAGLAARPGAPTDLFVSVNVSARQFIDHDLPADVTRAVAAANLSPGRLKLEITESLIMHDPETALTALRALRDAGTLLMLDDFGTGYSSLSYLHRFPFDGLKIDRSFVATMGQDANSASIVASIIGLAKALGLNIVAEGTETDAEVAALAALGADFCQGYFFGRPQTLESLTAGH